MSGPWCLSARSRGPSGSQRSALVTCTQHSRKSFPVGHGFRAQHVHGSPMQESVKSGEAEQVLIARQLLFVKPRVTCPGIVRAPLLAVLGDEEALHPALIG